MNSLKIELAAGQQITVAGRVRWALERLIEAGDRGVTPIETPAPRWAHYVWRLRQAGVVVETRHEQHGGPFPGTHARYILRSRIRIVIENSEAA